MSKRKYNDLNVLTIWIDNQKKFEKHKKQLDTIYNKLDKKSLLELGIQNEMIEKSFQRKNNLINSNKFVDKENNMVIHSKNSILNNKIDIINKRRNEMVDNQEVLTNKSPTIKLRSDILRKIKETSIQESNEFLAKRINSKHSSIDNKHFRDSYYKHQYYMNFNRKFELPKIETTGKHLSMVDNSTYNRHHETAVSFEDSPNRNEYYNKYNTLSKFRRGNQQFDSNNQNNISLTSNKDDKNNSMKKNDSNISVGYVTKQKSMNYLTQYGDRPFERNVNLNPFE